jgi:hypothetical protein
MRTNQPTNQPVTPSHSLVADGCSNLLGNFSLAMPVSQAQEILERILLIHATLLQQCADESEVQVTKAFLDDALKFMLDSEWHSRVRTCAVLVFVCCCYCCCRDLLATRSCLVEICHIARCIEAPCSARDCCDSTALCVRAVLRIRGSSHGKSGCIAIERFSH